MLSIGLRERAAPSRTVTGGHLVARALKAEGIEAIFTLCGGHILDIYDGRTDAGEPELDQATRRGLRGSASRRRSCRSGTRAAPPRRRRSRIELDAGEGRDQQQQARPRQVEVRHQRVDHPELERRADGQFRLAATTAAAAPWRRRSPARAPTSCRPPPPGRPGAWHAVIASPWRRAARPTRGRMRCCVTSSTWTGWNVPGPTCRSRRPCRCRARRGGRTVPA